ncbi:MAG: NAD(P)/FAD-dependent oxidoreductase [Acidobacteria bacterium]|nr:NAD(P)/FAD-dependent oxidoreductase [Acidobacteriota bacterium]
MTEEFDAIIVGGGPAGASAAVRLAAAGARVLLAERDRFPREKLCGEFISPECLWHFARLGVLEEMGRGGGARVWETVFYAPSGRGVSVPSAWFGGQGGDALGLSRAEMDARLLARAREAGVTVLEGAGLASLVVEGGRVLGVRLHADGGPREFRARVTLDATGRHRAVVRRAGRELGREGGEWRGGPESLVAFKTHLEGTRGAAGACELYFYSGGYGGIIPVERGLSNICFMVRARDVRACGSDPERVLREVLMRNRRAAETLKEATARTRWFGVSLEGFGRHEPAPFEGLLAVGDAAAFIDPFTGSGMLMALEGGEIAARAVSGWLARGVGKFAALAREYRAAYASRFDARLRMCNLIRRAAFAPAALVEGTILALNASAAVRRRVARSTRVRAA